jgi:radical SAM protein with 4Fe4S-binding SPASM domain
MAINHLPPSFGFRSEAAARFPEMVVVGMSFVCNARCIHCPNAATNFSATLQGADRLMTWPVLEQIARQCADQPTLLRISSFGEILVHPEVPMMVHLLDQKADRNVALTTNGSLLTPDKALILMEKKIRSIEFSVDAASRDTYETIRRGLTWETLLHNVTECVRLRDQHQLATRILVSVIEQPANQDQLEQIQAFWEHRVDKVLLRKMLSFKGIIPRPTSYTPYLPQNAPCPFLWERVVIDPVGNVRGCVSDVNAELVIGNIMAQPLSAIWRGQLMEAYRRRHLEGRIKDCPLCKDCVDVEYRSWTYNYFHALNTDDSAPRP